MNDPGIAWWNGRMVPEEEVRISPADAGFLFGDGLFETLRVDGGQARDVAAHLDRLLSGLLRIGISLPETRSDLEDALAEVAAAAPQPTARLRVTVTRGSSDGPTRLLTAAPYEPPGEKAYRSGVAVIVSEVRLDSGGPLAGLKSLCYQANRLALREAEGRGAWEALLHNERGRLVEGTRANLAVALPEGAFTPPEADGCLPGTVRRRLLEMGLLAERSLETDDLARAGEVVLLNSLVGVLPVARIDGRPLRPGPRTTAERLRAAWEEATSPSGTAARRPPPA